MNIFMLRSFRILTESISFYPPPSMRVNPLLPQFCFSADLRRHRDSNRLPTRRSDVHRKSFQLSLPIFQFREGTKELLCLCPPTISSAPLQNQQNILIVRVPTYKGVQLHAQEVRCGILCSKVRQI